MIIIFLFFILVFVLPTLITLPAMLSLPSGVRPGLEDLSLEGAAEQLSASDKEGWDLVELTRATVGERMAYCRRNNYQHYSKAFRRGYGFCQQKAFALSALLRQLGFESRPVQAVRNRFHDGTVSGHSWVEVSYGGITRYVDPQFQDDAGKLLFEPLTRVTGFGRVMRVLSSWGSAFVNALAYYSNGSDEVRIAS